MAAEVVRRVDEDGAFAAAALAAELDRSVQLDARDRSLATELVYGTLRVRPWLEERLARHATKGLGKLGPQVLAHLLVAAYQIFFLERVPPFAAVNAAVESISRLRDKRVGGFANAVLRKLAKERETIGEGVRREAIARSMPAWLRRALESSLGLDGAAAFVEHMVDAPPTSLRAASQAERDAWVDKLRASAGTFEAGKISPLAILARGAGKPQALAGVVEGALVVQEEGSQLVALALGARPGDRVLDACAGRGQKSGILARAVQPNGRVDVADLHPNKLERLHEELTRAGLAIGDAFAVDWTVGAGDVAGPYDRILIDAPCSGTGTLRRRPDLELRRVEDDVARLAAVQLAILRRVAPLVRPGGRVVYAVCSVLREEAEAVVEKFLAECTDFERAPFEAEAARAIAGDASETRLLPHVHGTDGYFLASLSRRA